jgi:peptidoglycan/xylan/chitin deacetylase (PgdA/CDA1 family)
VLTIVLVLARGASLGGPGLGGNAVVRAESSPPVVSDAAAGATSTGPAPVSAAPSCAASAATVVPRQPMTLTCAGFRPDSLIRVYWQGRPRSLAAFTAAPDGSGAVAVVAPEIAAGAWYARASDGAGLAAVVRFVVPAPAIAVSRLLAPGGEPFDLTLQGYWAGERVALRWYALDGSRFNTLRTATTSERGGAELALSVPGRSAVGSHRLAAVGLTSGLETAVVVTLTAEAVPYLDQGAAGCDRVAFIFNVGIGQPLDTGVLETLRANGVPATMFLSGWWAATYPELARRLRDGGFVVGSHGNGLGVLTGLSDAAVAADVDAANQAITDALGEPPAPWLTPYAAAIDGRVREIVWRQGYTPVGWRVTSGDWRPTSTEAEVYVNVVDHVYDGAIVEFHIDGAATAESTGRALPRIIATLRERGYRFVTIPEMAQPCAVHRSATASRPPATDRPARSAGAGSEPVGRGRRRRRPARRRADRGRRVLGLGDRPEGLATMGVSCPCVRQ